MAGIVVRATAAPISIPSSDDTTLLMVKAPANQRLKIREFGISFQGTDNLAAPVECQLLKVTTDGTGSAVTEVVTDASVDETLQGTATEAYGGTNEPTAGSIYQREFIHPQTKWHVVVADPDNLVVKGGERIALKAIGPGATVTACAWLEWEE